MSNGYRTLLVFLFKKMFLLTNHDHICNLNPNQEEGVKKDAFSTNPTIISYNIAIQVWSTFIGNSGLYIPKALDARVVLETPVPP